MYLDHSSPINKNVIFTETNLFWILLSGIFDMTGFICIKNNSIKYIQFTLPLYYKQLLNEILLKIKIGSIKSKNNYFIVRIYSSLEINMFLLNIVPFMLNNTLKSKILTIINISKSCSERKFTSVIENIKFIGILHCCCLFKIKKNDDIDLNLIIKHKDFNLILFIKNYLQNILQYNIYIYKHNNFYIIQIKSKEKFLILCNVLLHIFNELNFTVIILLQILKMYVLFDIYFSPIKNVYMICGNILNKLKFIFYTQEFHNIIIDDIIDDEIFDIIPKINILEVPKEFAHLF